MQKDIVRPKVEDIAVAVVREDSPEKDFDWYVHLINLKDHKIFNVMVTSKGYGTDAEGKELKTSTLRYVFEELDAESDLMIEPINEEVFGITNEFFISFYSDNLLYDKKYLFLPETIIESNLVQLPVIGKKGILIK